MTVSWTAPGRVNLIGEHTDYNGGFVLPFAIEQACTATVSTVADAELVITSAQIRRQVRVRLDRLVPGRLGWAGYPAGVVHALRQRGVAVPGLRIELDSTVPSGGGLSSSAAVACSVATAVDDLLGLRLSPDELLAVTRSAENDFVGAPTGGMDQLVSLRAVAGAVLFCDMRAVSSRPVPFDPGSSGLAVLVVDTRAPHRHADGDYRARRAGCEQAAALLGVPTLREVSPDELDAALARLPDERLRGYTRHVVSENARVLATVRLLEAGRLAEVGPLLTASHRSLRDDFVVSVPELDATVEALLAAGALGARLTGGGFGGSVIALVPAGGEKDAAAAVAGRFERDGFAPPTWFVTRPGPGAHRVRAQQGSTRS